MEIREPPATYEAYRRLPDDGPRYEIIGGVGFLTPAPGSRHQVVVGNLYLILAQHVRANGAGRVFIAPFDVVLSETDVVQPDLVFVSRERGALVKAKGLFGAPDLVVESLSPSTASRDSGFKLELYRHYGIREYWIVDPSGRTVELWTSAEAPLDRHWIVFDGAVESAVLPGLAVPLGEIFAGVEEIPGEED